MDGSLIFRAFEARYAAYESAVNRYVVNMYAATCEDTLESGELAARLNKEADRLDLLAGVNDG